MTLKTTGGFPPISADQFNAACDRIRNAGQLITGSLYASERYCAIGALLNGPDGFTPADLQEFDSIATGGTEYGDSFADALPPVALARLADVYGLSPAEVDAIVNANDGADHEGRTLAVIAVLAQFVV